MNHPRHRARGTPKTPSDTDASKHIDAPKHNALSFFNYTRARALTTASRTWRGAVPPR